MVEPNNMDSRFPASSPGLNFNAHGHLQGQGPGQGNVGNAMNPYKGPNANNPLDVNVNPSANHYYIRLSIKFNLKCLLL